MAFNIEAFKANGLIWGGARPSLFEVRLTTVPAGVPDVSEQLSWLCRSASIPALTVDSVNIPYFGRHTKVSGDRTFADWAITIMNDEDFALRNMFEAWNNKLNTLISNRLDGETPNDYKVDAEVIQYGKAGPSDDSGIIRSYLFVGLYPNTVGAIGLDWDATNAVETFDVNFSYDYFIPYQIGNRNPGYSPTLAPDSPATGIGSPPVPIVGG